MLKMPTAKAVDEDHVSGVFLGGRKTSDIDPATGLICLEHKDCKNPRRKGRTRFETLDYDGTNGYIYSSVKELSEKQESVVEIVNDALGSGWTYRQVRDYSGYSPTPVKPLNPGKNGLKKGQDSLPLVLVYQRTGLPLEKIFTERYGFSELKILTNKVVDVSDRITDLVKPRHVLEGVQVVYDWFNHLGSPGRGGDDVRIAMACLYFSDKAEQLHYKRIQLVESETRSMKLTSEIKNLEDELGLAELSR